MKITSLKEVDSYIYSSVILPLKDLDVASLPYSSPMRSKKGEVISFNVCREGVAGDFQHNFQRNEARNNAKWLVMICPGYNRYVAADYDPKRHNVVIYTAIMKALGISNVVVNKLADAFRGTTPFQKVTLVNEARDAHVYVNAPF